jgi:LAS superfamily LD-carboxypeptidase LdcB
MSLPKTPMVFPSTLHGQTNGNLPAHLLVKIGVGSALMEKTAARSFIAMFDEARKVGFNIKHVGHYRSFQEQLNLFLSRYEPVSLAIYVATSSSNRKKWDEALKYGHGSVYWRKRLINGRYPATAATPGQSNHGWGLALDIAEEYDSDA